MIKTFIFLLLVTTNLWATCSSPISRTNSSPNTVLTSSKYNTDLNTVYTHVNELDGDCLLAASVNKDRLELGYKDAAFTSQSTTYIALSTDEVVSASASGGAFTVTLPTAVGVTGRRYTVKKTDSTFNAVTIDGNAAETIDGGATYILWYQNQAATLVSNGTNWVVESGQLPGAISAPGVDKPKACYYFFGGASATLASPTECTTGTCVEVYDSCGTGTPPAFAATAKYQNITFASGTFANSTPVTCTCTAFDATAGANRGCDPSFETSDQTWSSNASGGFVFNVHTTDGGTTEATTYVQIKCEGQSP